MRVYLLCLLPMLLNACATPSANHIKAFSDSSARLIEMTQKVLNSVNESTINRKLYALATLPPDRVNTLSVEQFSNVRGIYIDKEKSPLLKAIHAVQTYMEALGMLSSADYRPQVDLASQKLYSALNRMSTQYNEITGKDLGIKQENYAAIATLFDAIGLSLIEAKRREAMKAIILEANPHVQKLCDAIIANIGNDMDLVRINLDRMMRERIEAYKKSYQRYSLDKKVAALKTISLYSVDIEKLPSLFQDAKTATEKVKTAHQVMADTVLQDQFSSARLAQEVGTMRSLGDHLRIHYKGLNYDP
ncbi:MAG: hypothetical protein OEZ68_16105 [Gammaproteobacteria bacterium]|nr:hypothetical protein [Gammaproteobacteria bacterium]MDH5802326.1 hypothetical protein [Gammaproteobacteria bacterium]